MPQNAHAKYLLNSMLLLTCACLGTPNQARAQRQDGTTFEGRLERRNPRDGEAYDSRALPLVAGKRYAIGAESSDFDPEISLSDPDGEVIAEDDDGGEGNNALLDFAPVTTGTYRVRVKAVGDNDKASARYRLIVRELQPLPAPSRPRPQNSTALRMETYSGELGRSDGEVHDKYVDDYLFHFERGQTALIFLNAEKFDSYLQIFTPQGRATGKAVGEDDDDGGNNNAMLAFTPEESGDYVVRATSAGTDSTGTYSLRVAIAPGN